MSDDFDSQLNVTQSDNPSLFEMNNLPPGTIAAIPDKPTASPLKLVASSAVSEPCTFKSTPSLKHYFTAEVRRRSPDDFIMVARDAFHYLHCELPLTLEKSEEALSMICQFPTMDDDVLLDFIQGDEALLGMVLISFQMQILNHLFLLCATHNAEKLIIKVTEEQYQGLGIYQEFIQYVDKIPTKQGMAIEITIPVHSNSLELCGEFLEDITRQFRKTLWKEQTDNPAIREYLKTNVRFSVVV